MANYYTDIPELKYHLNNPMMERICELKERNYRDKEEFDYAPQDYADAMDSFDKVLEITGEITGEIIAPNAEGVDEEGPHCANGRVEYASGTKQNLDAMVKAGLNGMTMPRRFGGLNFPITPYTMCAEIVAAADAAAALFAGGASAANVPSFTLTKAEFAADSRVTTMLVKSGLCKSQSDARNQVKAGAVLVADKKVDDLNATLAESDVPADGLLIQKGKKNFRRLFLA